MELKFSKIVDREKKKVDMFIYGCLGEAAGEVNGHYFAQELNWVGRNYDEITVRINCEGGDVLHGLSIISEMMISPAYIIASVDGVAASMGAVLLAAADKVKMNDYAKVMIHSPYYVDENGDAIKNLTDKAKKGLNSIKEILNNLLAKRGITAERIAELMKTDSWFSADEALTEKLVDEIVSTGRKAELVAIEPMKLVAKLKQENNSNFTSMKKVIAKLNGLGLQLAEDANEDQVVAAMDQLPTGSSEKPAAKLVDQLIAVGKKTGAITEGETGNEAKFRKLADTDMELFVDMLGIDKLTTTPAPKATPAPQARMSELIAQAKQNPQAAAAGEKDFAWYEKNDPKALARMEQTDPEKFAKLKAADDARYE
jgi:ATP-dependent Clp endopeptidase proteolytic subunit ClpP